MARQQSRVTKKVPKRPATKAKRAPARGRPRERRQVVRILEVALRAEFPHDTVDISDGYRDNIHVLVVSRRFDTMNEREKQDLLWGIIDGTELSEDERSLISLLLALSPAEIK